MRKSQRKDWDRALQVVKDYRTAVSLVCSSNRGKAERGWVSWSGWERVGDRGRCGTQKEVGHRRKKS